MKYIKFITIGFLFGIIMYKSQAASWYRIHEMFRFESFHMYGIIGSALTLGIILVQIIKRTKMKTIYGEPISFTPKAKSITRYLLGGTIFGLGWALTGACPGPMYVLLGTGEWSILIVLISAVIGTFIYGYFRAKLPH
ncbi:DUF6691 family protein [Crocinitomix algicola]|uniref:DUF6691 family protein n=1 Tax=Crocinitomix algicola TaxID=1740263 RepID=UPI000871DF22|nr:DUF6691 family protein [Crocinitomix algicola]